MNELNVYLSGRDEAPSPKKLNKLIDRYPWFTTARRARVLLTGEPDPALILPLSFWPTLAPKPASEAIPAPQNAIDRFIEHGGYRITPSDSTSDASLDSQTDIDPEMVSAELAEIYLAQGLTEKADAIYRILSLRNS